MRFQFDHDYHIHSYISPCSSDPQQTPENILKYAQANGLKEIVLTILPALAVLYATLGKIWGLPYGAEIPATIMAVDALLGACLHISTSEYRKGGDANV